MHDEQRSASSHPMTAALALACVVPLLAACSAGGSAESVRTAPAPPRFAEVAHAAGITHRHERPELDPRLANIMPWMSSVGAAAAAGDYDGDGRIDLYVTNSRKGRPNWLYRNLGDGRFAEVARAAGLAEVNDDAGLSMDCVFGDYDNDGWIDLYLVR
jgi:hypothetical protein